MRQMCRTLRGCTTPCATARGGGALRTSIQFAEEGGEGAKAREARVLRRGARAVPARRRGGFGELGHEGVEGARDGVGARERGGGGGAALLRAPLPALVDDPAGPGAR
jgi:hypothetical protein